MHHPHGSVPLLPPTDSIPEILRILVFALVLLGLAGGLGMVAATPPEAPSSVIPTPRTDEWAVARQAELLRRARESAPARIVFVGDSITQSWEEPGKAAWATHLAPLGSLNLGNSGDRTEHVLWRLGQAPLARLAPEHVFLLIGTNNLGHGTSTAAETLQGIVAVARTLATQCPTATIHLIEIFPRGEKFNAMRGEVLQVNQALRAWVEGANRERGRSGGRDAYRIHAVGDAFVSSDGSIAKDMMPDSLHLAPVAYEIWAKAVVDAIR